MFINLLFPALSASLSFAATGYQNSTAARDLSFTDQAGKTATVPDGSHQWEGCEISVTGSPCFQPVGGVNEIPAFCLVD
jgi:hypothetical protein